MRQRKGEDSGKGEVEGDEGKEKEKGREFVNFTYFVVIFVRQK